MKIDLQAPDFPAFWASQVNSGDVDAVVALYNEKATLLPTFSPKVVKDRTGLINYFTGLASKEGAGVELQDDTVVCLPAGQHGYVTSGMYAFRFKVDGSLQTFPSRFTFVIDLAEDSPILHHHSSLVPTAPD